MSASGEFDGGFAFRQTGQTSLCGVVLFSRRWILCLSAALAVKVLQEICAHFAYRQAGYQGRQPIAAFPFFGGTKKAPVAAQSDKVLNR
ncbi:MAG TPA: hypothetical protein VHO66_09440 [Ruminiclostridium sp.]|nr:hypothetical protein [Ruminiclostridium sp.]